MRRFLLIAALLILALPAARAEEGDILALLRGYVAAIAAARPEAADRFLEQAVWTLREAYPELTGPLTGLSDTELAERQCQVRRVVAPYIDRLLAGSLPASPHFRFAALVSRVYDDPGIMAELIGLSECVDDWFSRTVWEAVDWAQSMAEAPADELRAEAARMEALAEAEPQTTVYADIATVLHDAADEKDPPDPRFEENPFLWAAWLTENADGGDLAVQMELAQRYETGDQLELSPVKAVYWYRRAIDNGGGQPAIEGLERLQPLLSDVDRLRLDVWREVGIAPHSMVGIGD